MHWASKYKYVLRRRLILARHVSRHYNVTFCRSGNQSASDQKTLTPFPFLAHHHHRPRSTTSVQEPDSSCKICCITAAIGTRDSSVPVRGMEVAAKPLLTSRYEIEGHYFLQYRTRNTGSRICSWPYPTSVKCNVLSDWAESSGRSRRALIYCQGSAEIVMILWHWNDRI